MLTIGGIIFLGVLYYLFVFSPGVKRERMVRERIRKKESDIRAMMQLKREWQTLRASKIRANELLKRRGKQFALLSFLEGLSREVGINDRIQYMKPVLFQESSSSLRQVGVEVRLDGLSMKDLVQYLYRIEYSDAFLAVPRIKIQRVEEKGTTASLRVTMQVRTYISQ